MSNGSPELVKCLLKFSFKSLLTPMSWNILCSLLVYSYPHAWGKEHCMRPSPRIHICILAYSPPSYLLQFGDHWRLGVVAGAHVLHLWDRGVQRSLNSMSNTSKVQDKVIHGLHYSYQSLSQHLAVELLEHILVLDVLEHHHHLLHKICERKTFKQYNFF